MTSKLPYPEQLAVSYPPGIKPDKRRIIRYSRSRRGEWYKNKIGQIISIHYFGTFGAWDMSGQWMDYYDLSKPIIYESYLHKIKWFFVRIFYRLKNLFSK